MRLGSVVPTWRLLLFEGSVSRGRHHVLLRLSASCFARDLRRRASVSHVAGLVGQPERPSSVITDPFAPQSSSRGAPGSDPSHKADLVTKRGTNPARKDRAPGLTPRDDLS
eukprot:scaffold47_cov334-Pavlova_lutheri.AAC.55